MFYHAFPVFVGLAVFARIFSSAELLRAICSQQAVEKVFS